jgi:hypothetical protein
MDRDDDTPGDSLAANAHSQGDRAPLRPRHCWEIVRQVPGLHFNCEECYAFFVQQDCWTLWALRRPGFKPCCQKEGDCTQCVVLTERMRPQSNQHMEIERARPIRPAPAPSKRICGYLQLYSGGQPIEGEGRNAAVTRAMQMRSADFRCRLRGVHLDMGYVSDVCVSRHIEECVFLEEARPEVHVRTLPMAKQSFEAETGKRPGEKDSPVPTAPNGAGRRGAKG